jgi:hypothetical protein
MLVSHRRGLVPRIARRLYRKWNHRWLFKLGFIPFPMDKSYTPIGIALTSGNAYDPKGILVSGHFEIPTSITDKMPYMIRSDETE